MMLAELRELRLEVQRLTRRNAELEGTVKETSETVQSGYLTPQAVADGGLEKAVLSTPSSAEPPVATVSGDAPRGAGASGAPVGSIPHESVRDGATSLPGSASQEATMVGTRADAGDSVQGMAPANNAVLRKDVGPPLEVCPPPAAAESKHAS